MAGIVKFVLGKRAMHKRRILIFSLGLTVLAGLLFLAGGFAVGTPRALAQSSTESVTGTFYFVTGGNPTRYYLQTDAKTTLELQVDDKTLEAAGGLWELNRTQVTVSGQRLGLSRFAGVAGVFQVSGVKPTNNPNGAPSREAFTGAQPFANILCKFSDSQTTTPKDKTFFTNLMSSTYPGMDNYFQEASFGVINLSGTIVVDWVVLPSPRSTYVVNGSANLGQLAKDCTAAADAQINFATVRGINLMFNGELDGYAWGGSWYLTLDSVSKVWPITWMPPWGYGNQAVLAHEMGHAFGMPHSGDSAGTTYKNVWDVMSDTWTNCGLLQDPTFGCLGQHEIAYHKDLPGWIAPARKWTAGSLAAETIYLERLAQPGPNGYLMAKIPVNGSTTDYYTVEARKRVGFDKKVPAEGVIVHRVTSGRTNPAWVMDATGGSTNDANLVPGASFSDPTIGLQILVTASSSTGYSVTITLGNAQNLVVNDPPASGTLSGTTGTKVMYKFVADMTGSYSIETFAGSLTNSVLELYDGRGTLLTSNTNGGTNGMSLINQYSLNPGTYFATVRSASGSTGTFNIQVTMPLLVTKDVDDAQAGSLSFAASKAISGATISFSLSGTNTVKLTQPVTLSSGVRISGGCSTAGPTIILDGSTAPNGTNGLILTGSNQVSGLLIQNFPGKQLVLNGRGNKFSCTSVRS